jgi:N-acetylmuramoyl-L-alanine amidase
VIRVILILMLMFCGPVCAAGNEHECLALNIYHEAKGESVDGMIAVAAVTVNRRNNPSFPKKICDVVYQPGQFSWVGNSRHPRRDSAEMKLSRAIAVEYLDGGLADPTNGALFFHAKYVKPNWRMKRTAVIGNHVFYALIESE